MMPFIARTLKLREKSAKGKPMRLGRVPEVVAEPPIKVERQFDPGSRRWRRFIVHYPLVFLKARGVNVYDHPTFQMACQQFDLVADYLQIPHAERDRIKYPKRSLTVALPIHRDNGDTQVFTGYRVQHHLTLGPTKGGLRYHPDG